MLSTDRRPPSVYLGHLLLLLLLLLLQRRGVSSISCYRCISRDGDSADCEDPFQVSITTTTTITSSSNSSTSSSTSTSTIGGGGGGSITSSISSSGGGGGGGGAVDLAPCMGGRQLLSGLYPSTACMKLAGVFQDSGERVLVRGCALDSGQLVSDSGVVRVSHCGGLIFQDRHVHGCLQSCDDMDGCNGCGSHGSSLIFTLALVAAAALMQ